MNSKIAVGFLAAPPSLVPEKHFWPRELALGLVPILIGLNLLISVVYLRMGLSGFADFRQLYAGGYMIRTGQAHDLYDYDKQQAIEEQLVPLAAHFPLPVNHPAFEELLFAPMSYLSYRSAFCIFLVINLVLLFVCVRLLQSQYGVLKRRWSFFIPCL